jgi:hypothetical protein
MFKYAFITSQVVGVIARKQKNNLERGKLNWQSKDDNLKTLAVLWGLITMLEIWLYVITTTGSVYPLSEHVDIFLVRLVSTFHRVFSVYLILAFYLT